MTTHPGYFTDGLGDQPWYRCCSCKFDTFSPETIKVHAKLSHPPLVLPENAPNRLQRKTVGISLLTWNTKTASEYAITAILREIRILQGLGIRPRMFWVDNGSTDGTVDTVHDCIEREYGMADAVTLHADNEGQSRARNEIISNALAFECDYLVMVDGDIEIVPRSAYALANFLDGQPESLGCAGIYCRNCADGFNDPDVATECLVIEPWMTDPQPGIAWTNYGVFRRSVLEQCKFDENGPFNGPGWGFEDDDYYLAMLTAGYGSVNTKYFRHYHRRRHSSLRLLDRTLAAKVYAERRTYVANKWRKSAIPAVQSHVALIENQTMPVV